LTPEFEVQRDMAEVCADLAQLVPDETVEGSTVGQGVAADPHR
jgi:hypothetical protein